MPAKPVDPFDHQAMTSSLQSALDVAQVGAWGWDEAAHTKLWPPQTKAIFGLAPEVEMTRELFVSMLHPEDVARYRAAWAAALDPAGDRLYQLKYRIRRARDGAERWIWSKAQVTFEGDRPAQVMGALRDITDDVVAFDRLRASEHQLSLFIEHAPAAIAMFDRDMHYLAASARWNRVFGLTGSLVGRSHYAVFPEIDDDWKAVHRRCLAGAVEQSAGEAFRRADGSIQWVKWEVRPWYDGAGGIGGLMINSEDITARRRSELASAHLAAIVTSSSDAIISKRLDGSIISWNRGAERLFGYDADEIIGQSITRLIPAGNTSEEAEIIARISRGERIEHYETIRVAKDGREIAVSVTISPIFDPLGTIVAASKIVRDISERKAAEAHVALLMAEVDHRARNLLAVVQAIAVATRKFADPKTFVEDLTRRIAGLAASQDLLIRNQWHGIEVGDLVRAQLAPFLPASPDRVDVAGPQARLAPAAAQGIGLALHELATNASKYGAFSAGEGRVTIRWQVAPSAQGEPTFTLRWREEGGPPVAPPTHSGFGQKVMVAMTEASVRGRVHLDHDAAGLCWTLVAPSKTTLE